MTLVIFHRSIRRPMKTLTCTTKLVSLSSMYNSTTRDWKTPNMMERTDRPSRDCLLFQNWISAEEMVVRWSWRCINTVWTILLFKKNKHPEDRETAVILPFLKARNSKMLCTMETTIVSPSRYGLVSKRATYKKKVSPLVTDSRFILGFIFSHKVHGCHCSRVHTTVNTDVAWNCFVLRKQNPNILTWVSASSVHETKTMCMWEAPNTECLIFTTFVMKRTKINWPISFPSIHWLNCGRFRSTVNNNVH